MLEHQGTTMTDEQLRRAARARSQSYGQDLPLEQSVRLVREGGAWKICQAAIEAPATP